MWLDIQLTDCRNREMKKLSCNLIFTGLLAVCLSAVLAGYFAVHQLKCPPEAAMRLSCGALIADGARPYIDFLDNSSPFALYLAALPALISKTIFVHPICIFNMLVVLLTLISLLLVINRASGRSPRLLMVQFCLPAIALGVALTQLHFLSQFGQEGILFFLFFLPYLVQRYLSLSALHTDKRRVFPALIGVLASFGLLLNPVCLVAFAAVEFACLFSLGNISLTKLKQRYVTTELVACLLSLLALSLALFCLAPLVVREYLGPITKINQLTFEYFNDDLSYVGKSPDRRDLVYTFVVFFILSLPVAGRCLLTRLMCLMAAFGFGCFVFSATLFSHQGILMIAYSLVALLLSGARYMRSIKPIKRFCGSLAIWCQSHFFELKNKQLIALVSSICVVALVSSVYASSKSVKGKSFALSELGYYGYGLERDLSFFSKTVKEASAARDSVWIYSEQASPAYPLLTQLRRKPGYLIWGFPLHTLRVLHERGTPLQVAELSNFEATMYDRLRVEMLSPHPPTLVLIEDGEVRDLFKANGIISIIEQFYSPIDSCSPLNGDEIASHDPYEYLGYRVTFSADKLKLNK